MKKLLVSCSFYTSRGLTMSTATGLDTLTLNPGSKCPPVNPEKLRVYNMRFCPYAQRTLLALGAKNIPFEIVNVNLKYKPDWFVAKNPLGKVPTMEYQGKIVYESGVCNEYLDKIFPESKSLLPADPYLKAQQKMLAERLGNLSSAMHRSIRAADEPSVQEAIFKALNTCEEALSGDFFGGGSTPGWSDYMIWPWFERFGAVELISDGKITLEQDKFPKLNAYIQRMLSRPEVKEFYRSPQQHVEFFKSFASGEPNYDIGIDKAAQL